MELLIAILAAVAVIFGIVLLFSKGAGSFLAAGISIFAGVYAYDSKALWPLAVGFAGLWALRLLGFEKR